MTCKQVLHPIANSININNKVWEMYFRDIIPRLVKEGDDGNNGSTAVCDTMCLQVFPLILYYSTFLVQFGRPVGHKLFTYGKDKLKQPFMILE